MSVVGCLLDLSTERRHDQRHAGGVMIHDGWCPDCDVRSAVIDIDTDNDRAWATCTECGAGWIWREDVTEHEPVRPVAHHEVRQAA
jgi:transcription elongation factor Elf1